MFYLFNTDRLSLMDRYIGHGMKWRPFKSFTTYYLKMMRNTLWISMPKKIKPKDYQHT